MIIKIIIDETLNEDEAVLTINKMTGSIEDAVRTLTGEYLSKINGVNDREIFMIDVDRIEYFFTFGQKVLFKSEGKEYEVKYKVYELESMLAPTSFVKINQGVLANIDRMKSVRTLINGTMEVTFLSGSKEYVSRRNVSLLRKTLEV